MQRNITLAAAWLTVLFPVAVLLGNAPQDIILSAIALLFLLHSYLARDWNWCRRPWVQCLALLWAYMIVRGAIADYDFYATDHAAFTGNSFEALRRSLPFGRYFVFAAALAYWTLRDNATRQRFFKVLAAAVFLLAADCLLQWILGKDILLRPLLRDNANHIRLTGPYRSPMPGIILAWLSFLAFLPFLLTGDGTLKQGAPLLKAGAYCLFILSAIAFTGERVALLNALAGWVLAILLLPNKRALIIVLGFGIVALGVLGLANPLVFERQAGTTFQMLHDWKHNPYGQLLDTDLKLAAQHPVFGAGTNYFRHNCPKLYPGYDQAALAGVCNIHPHNIYMEWLIDTGVIGFGLFVSFLFFAARECVRAWPHARTNPCFIGCIVAFTMRVWPFASTTNFSSPFGAPPYWLVLGALLAMAATVSEGAGKNQDTGA